MKKTSVVAMTIMTVAAAAQKPIVVMENAQPMTKGTQVSLTVEIPQVKLKDVQEEWFKYVRQGSKSKATEVSGVYVQTGAVNMNVAPNPFTVYSRLIEVTDGVRITAWITENDIVFVSEQINNSQDLAAKAFLRTFAITQYREAVKEELHMAQDKLSALQKQQDNNIKASDKSERKVNANNRSVQKSTDQIAVNDNNINDRTQRISNQKDMVNTTASDPNANKGAKKTLKGEENDKRNMENNSVSQQKNIEAKDEETRHIQRDQATQEEQHTDIAAKIVVQKKNVAEVQAKLDNIK